MEGCFREITHPGGGEVFGAHDQLAGKKWRENVAGKCERIGKRSRIECRTKLNKLDSAIECISNDGASLCTQTEQRN
jgi:hypothetical protein